MRKGTNHIGLVLFWRDFQEDEHADEFWRWEDDLLPLAAPDQDREEVEADLELVQMLMFDESE